MKIAKCPECGARVRVSSAAEIGDEVTCQSCGEELEVIETEPLTLGYLGSYEDEIDEEDEFDEELEDEEEVEDEDFEDEEEDDEIF
jgi:alpha-aminoadipate carrier protein LysW